MLHATSEKPTQKQRGRKTKFPGITADAKRLGVNRSTLWRTLTGEWKLPGLRRRYQALKTKEVA